MTTEAQPTTAQTRGRGGVAVGLLMALALVGAAVWWFFLRPDVQPHVGVFGANGQELVLMIENERVQMTGDRAEFLPVPRTLDVPAEMKRQIPGAVTEGDAVRIVADGAGFALYASLEREGAWVLEAEFIALGDGAQTFDVPFPTRTVTSDDRANWRVESSCDLACLTDFYAPYDGIVPSDGGFTVTLPNGVIEVERAGDAYEFRPA